MPKGAIDLIATRKAMQQAVTLEKNLEKVENRIISISKEVRKMSGDFKKVDTKSKLADEVDKIKKKVDALDKSINKWKKDQKKLDTTVKRSTTDLRKHNAQVKDTGKNYSTASVRVKSFFKTLIAFDLARRLVDSFWDSFKKGFQTLKILDSLRLQFQFVVGDMQEVAQTQSFLSRISNQYGADLIVLSERYIKFRAATQQSNISSIKTMAIFESLTKAAGVLGLKTHELEGIFLAVEQMISKGKITTEELRRQLGERLPGAFSIMAEAVGVNTQKLDEMLRKGEILSSEFLPKFADALEKAYGIENIKNINTLQAATVRFDNTFTKLVKNLEGGESRISKVFIKLLNIATVLTDAFGELFLSQDQIDKAAKVAGESKGINEATKIFKKIKEESDKSKKSSDEFFKAIAKESSFAAIEAVRLRKEIKKINDELDEPSKRRKALSSDPIERLNESVLGKSKKQLRSQKLLLDLRKKYLDALGFEEGVMKGLNQLLDDQKNKTDKIIESRSKATNLITPEMIGSDALIFDLEKIIKKIRLLRKATSDPIELNFFNEKLKIAVKFLKLLKGDIDATSISEKELEKWTESVAEEMRILGLQLDQADKNTKKLGKTAEETAKEKIRKLVDSLEILGDQLSALADIGDALFERSITRLEAEMDKNQERYDHERELIEASVANEENKQFRLKLLDEEKEKRDKQIQNKIAKEKKKQFLINKAASLSEIAINTAVWVTTAGKQAGIFGLTLAPLIIALGALQAAAVLLEPVPNFKGGHLEGTYEGIANVNDGVKDGKTVQEFWKRGDKIQAIEGKNTKIRMKKGDQIIKDQSSLMDFLPQNTIIKSLHNASIMTSLNSDRDLIDGLKPSVDFNKNFMSELKSDMISTIKSSMASWSIHNHTDGAKIAEAIADAIDNNNYKNNMS